MKICYLIVSFSCLLLLAGCQTTQVKLASFEPSATSNQQNKTEFVYNPSGKEQFVFHEKAESLQKYGYDKFCESTKTFACYNRLQYQKYVGMKGYFDTSSPVKTDYSGYEFYPVILDNGEKYYFVANSKRGGKYGSFSPIISLEQYIQLKSFTPEPLIPNSEIQLLSNKVSYGSKYYTLSNGKQISKKNLKLIREVCARFGNKPEMAELLLDMEIDKDEVDYRFFISPTGTSLRSEAKLYIGFNDKDQWLRFKVKYYGDDWLFVSSYKVAADDYRWQSPKMNFERDHSSGSVWEWVDVSAKNKEIEVAKALANAGKSTIRFQGNQYYSDKQLDNDQKIAINKILRLYSLMGGA
jgi:hypothetical protein